MDEYPKLRNIEILPITQGNEKKLFFRDSQNITDKTLTLPYKYILIVKYLDGNHDIRDIQAKIMRETGELLYSDDIKSLVELLDKCYFLDNQNFSKLKNQVEQDFKKQKIRKSILSGNSYPADGDS